MSQKIRLDHLLVEQELASTRSQAENLIRLGKVHVNDKLVTKPGYFANELSIIKLANEEQYVSRAGLKLASVAEQFKLDFTNKIVLDVGSSTGGFTDYALRRGASHVIAVDVGTDQLHASLRPDARIDLHEKTDIRRVYLAGQKPLQNCNEPVFVEPAVDIAVMDVSFVSLRHILPHIPRLLKPSSGLIVAMLKPQFEADDTQKHKGVIKNDRMRRDIIHQFERWLQSDFAVLNKADSGVSGAKGNQERFYLLKPRLPA